MNAAEIRKLIAEHDMPALDKLEQEVYIAEEVEWNFVSYEDNQPACQLHQNSVRTL